MQVVFKSLSDGGQSLGKASDILTKDNSTIGPLLNDFGEAADGGVWWSTMVLWFCAGGGATAWGLFTSSSAPCIHMILSLTVCLPGDDGSIDNSNSTLFFYVPFLPFCIIT